MIRAAPGTGLLLDGAGTLLHPREPIAETYAAIGREHGVHRTPEDIARGFRDSMGQRAQGLRYVGDARPFWRDIVRAATGSGDAELFEALYLHFGRAEAWRVAQGARECCDRVRARGMRVAVVSNWDTRLRPLLEALGVVDWVDEIVISAEVGLEKPDPAIFTLACARLGVEPARALHVGDDSEADVTGARSAGCAALLFGHDLTGFRELASKLA